MKEISYHNIRQQMLSHVEELNTYAREIGCQIHNVAEVFPPDRPVTIAVIGHADAGTNEIVAHVIGGRVEPTSQDLSENQYHCTHFPGFRPALLEGLEKAGFSEHEHEVLRRCSLVEFFTHDFSGPAPVDPVLEGSDGIIFVIDARDPWSGRIWKHFENYGESHRNRIYVFLNRLDQIDSRDWEVLQKHLEEKVFQLTGTHLDVALANSQASFERLRLSLDNTNINRSKWNELKRLTTDLNQAIGDVDTSMQEQLIWQANAASFSEELESDLAELRVQLEEEMAESIESAEKTLSARAREIVEKTRSSFTTKQYLRSSFRRSTSLSRFYDHLEQVVCDTLFTKLTSCYTLINASVTTHAKGFKENYGQLARELTKFQGELDQIKVPFILKEKEVSQEVSKTMQEWDVKTIFEEQLYQIDRKANLRIKLALLLVIAAGVTGALGLNAIGIALLFLGCLTVPVALYLRRHAVRGFCDFLYEWFVSFGPRMKQSTEQLGGKIVDHAIDYYRDCFTTVLEQVEERKEKMPERFVRAHDLTEVNKKLIDVLQSR